MSLEMTLEELESVFDPELFEDWLHEFGDYLGDFDVEEQKLHFMATAFHRTQRDKCIAEIKDKLDGVDGEIARAQREVQGRLKYKDSEHPHTRKWYAEAHRKEQSLQARRELLLNAIAFHEQGIQYHNDRWVGSSLLVRDL